MNKNVAWALLSAFVYLAGIGIAWDMLRVGESACSSVELNGDGQQACRDRRLAHMAAAVVWPVTLTVMAGNNLGEELRGS